MPWTLAHPAAILPLRGLGRFRLPLAALVVGSFSPDFGYYLNQFRLAAFAHTPLGVLLICVPAGALALSLFTAVRRDLINLLPQPHRGALLSSLSAYESARPLEHLLAAVVGLFVGAATHVVWDSFTHASGYAVQLLPVLQTPVLTVGARPMYVYSLLQHASTVTGLCAMLLVYRRWLGQQQQASKTDARYERRRYLVLAGCLVVACTAGVLLAATKSATGDTGSSINLFRVVVLTTNAFSILLVLAALMGRERGNAT